MKIKISNINSIKEWTYNRDLKRFRSAITKRILDHVNKKDRLASYLSNKFLIDYMEKNKIDPCQASYIDNKKWIIKSSSKFFSASRSGDYVIFGEDNIPLGIDIQKMDNRFEFLDIATRLFSRHELNSVLTSLDPMFTFYEIWGNKESLYKCVNEPVNVHNLQLQGKKEKWYATFKNHKYHFKNIIYDNDYMISICSFHPITDEIIYKDTQDHEEQEDDE